MTYDEPPFDPYDATPPTSNGTGPSPEAQAELAVLGAMIAAPKTIPDVVAILRGRDYADPIHETIHTALEQLHTAGDNIDAVTLAEHLGNTPGSGRGQSVLDNLTDRGGPLYIHTLLDACPTPGAAEHYANIVRSAARRRTIVNTGTRIAQIGRSGTLEQLETAFTHAYETLDDAAADFGPAATPPTTWAPVNLDPVLAGDYLDPPPTMLRRTDGTALFYAGAVHTISGESETGKTWVTLEAARQELADDHKVTFVDFEDRADRVVSRLLALGATPTQIRDGFAYIRPDRPLDDTGRHQLTPALVGRTLVIVDGVTEAMTLHGLDLNSNQDSATFQALIPRWIADHGPAVAMIDHVVKDKDKQDRFAIGAQHKLAGIDGAAYVVKALQPFARGRRGVAQLIVSKDRPGYVREQAFGKIIAEFTLDNTVDEHIVTADLAPPGILSGKTGDHTFEPTHLMEKISAFVAANPGLSKKAIEDLTNGRASTIRLALELLVTRGYIRVEQAPRNSTKHYSERPYYEHDNDDTEE